VPGVHPADARRLRAAMELGRRLAAPAPSTTRAIQSAVDVADWFRCQMQDLSRESLHALLLDGKNRPVKHLALAEGSWNSCPVDPKVVFSACLRHAAPALILVHNHPSGDPSPSRDDLELTERLLRAGQVIGIRVLDHLIVGREGYLSLADHGFM
jgi:DNA repair protein RadC